MAWPCWTSADGQGGWAGRLRVDRGAGRTSESAGGRWTSALLSRCEFVHGCLLTNPRGRFMNPAETLRREPSPRMYDPLFGARGVHKLQTRQRVPPARDGPSPSRAVDGRVAVRKVRLRCAGSTQVRNPRIWGPCPWPSVRKARSSFQPGAPMRNPHKQLGDLNMVVRKARSMFNLHSRMSCSETDRAF